MKWHSLDALTIIIYELYRNSITRLPFAIQHKQPYFDINTTNITVHLKAQIHYTTPSYNNVMLDELLRQHNDSQSNRVSYGHTPILVKQWISDHHS